MTPTPPTPAAQPATPAEAALREYKSLWETISRVSGEYVAVVDRAGTIIFCNRVGPGFTVDQVVGHHIARFTVPESSALLEKNIREVFETGEERSLETTVRLLDGGYDYFALRMGPVAIAGRTVAVLVCCESTRTLKMSEESLRHERHVLRRLIEVQERERQLVSYEIHDGLSQYLAGAMMHLQAFDHALRSTDGGRGAALAASGDLREGLRLVRAAVDESRRLIGGLRPPALDELGLVAAVESLVSEARADIRRVSFAHTLPCGRMPAHLETTIFRIVQESLSNVRKHAQARSAEVAIEQAPLPDGRCAVRVAVRDDGVGFEPAGVPADRFGLEGIRQRCRLVGGEPSIQSRPGGGTTIEAVLPLPVATG